SSVSPHCPPRHGHLSLRGGCCYAAEGFFFFKQKTAYEIGLGIPAEPLFRSTNKIPKHLFQGYLNIYNNYFKAPWMPDRTEANPNELNQDDARYGFRCCHLKNIWTAPLPPETE